MALPKLFQRLFFHNNTTPALNEDNLNAMSKAIDDIDNRVINLGADVMEAVPELREMIEDVEALSENPPYIGANGHWYVWNITDGEYVDSGIDASITVTIADITMLDPEATPYVTNTGTDTDPIFHLFIPRGKGIATISKTGTSGLVDTYTIYYTDDYFTTFTVTNGKTAYQYAQDGGYTGTENEFTTYMGNISMATTDATNSALDAEAWAHGTRNGVRIGSTDPAYEKYALYYAHDAYMSYTHTVPLEESARNSSSDAEAYAVGKRGGVDVESTDPAYHNNSKYYAEQAGNITWSGVASKPFSTIGNGLNVSNDALQADVQSVNIGTTGTASASGVAYQRMLVNGSEIGAINGTRYMEQSVTLSTSAEVTATFTNAAITTSSAVEVYTSDPNLVYKTMSISNGSCDVTFEKQSSASTITVRLYIR